MRAFIQKMLESVTGSPMVETGAFTIFKNHLDEHWIAKHFGGWRRAGEISKKKYMIVSMEMGWDGEVLKGLFLSCKNHWFYYTKWGGKEVLEELESRLVRSWMSSSKTMRGQEKCPVPPGLYRSHIKIVYWLLSPPINDSARLNKQVKINDVLSQYFANVKKPILR